MSCCANDGYNSGVHKLENPNDLESLVANEDVIYLLLHSPQDSEEILVNKNFLSFTSISC